MLISSAANWAHEEFKSLKLNNKTNVRRLKFIIESIAKSPESSINKASGDWKNSKAAYRLFQNEKIEISKILEAHQNETKKRSDDFSTILLIQDTSYISYNTHNSVVGLGKIGGNRNSEGGVTGAMGLCMHTTLAVSAEAIPIGIANQSVYARDKNKNATKKVEKVQNRDIKIEDKESNRWLEHMEATCNLFDSNEKRIVTVCDRESDIFDFFKKAETLNHNFVVRAAQNRILKKSKDKKNEIEKLWDFTSQISAVGEVVIKIPARNTIPARDAKLEIRYRKVSMNVPERHPTYNPKSEPPIKLNAISIKESTSTCGTNKPLEWMLLTNLPIENLDNCIEALKFYCLRWRIEIFHKILKSGLKVEDCRLSTSDRLTKYLTITSIVAWRIFYMTHFSRSNPDEPCTKIVTDREWKILYFKFNTTKALPKQHPTTLQVVKWIAQLGGFLARKGDGDPGPITLWRGIRRFYDLCEGADIKPIG